MNPDTNTTSSRLKILTSGTQCPVCTSPQNRATSIASFTAIAEVTEDMMILAPDRGDSAGGGKQKADRSTRSRANKPDVYEIVTERILSLLEQGTTPWLSSSIARVGRPRNFLTKKHYSGINVFLLASAGFQSPDFLTYRQAQELGGQVRKGEKGLAIIKMGTWQKKSEDVSSTSASLADEEKPREARFLKLCTVFNACQIDGIAFPELPKCPSFTESDIGAQARRITEHMPNPPIIHIGQKAYPHYVPSDDTVHMPTRESFRSECRFHKTLFHELAHATGHATRLNRTTLTENRGMYAVGKDKKIYCLEELTAEMAAAFLATHAGIVEDDLQQSAAYLKGWLDVLRVPDHKKWLIKAASEAQKAADYILSKER